MSDWLAGCWTTTSNPGCDTCLSIRTPAFVVSGDVWVYGVSMLWVGTSTIDDANPVTGCTLVLSAVSLSPYGSSTVFSTLIFGLTSAAMRVVLVLVELEVELVELDVELVDVVVTVVDVDVLVLVDDVLVLVDVENDVLVEVELVDVLEDVELVLVELDVELVEIDVELVEIDVELVEVEIDVLLDVELVDVLELVDVEVVDVLVLVDVELVEVDVELVDVLDDVELVDVLELVDVDEDVDVVVPEGSTKNVYPNRLIDVAALADELHATATSWNIDTLTVLEVSLAVVLVSDIVAVNAVLTNSLFNV